MSHLERLAITTHAEIYPVAGGERLKSGRLRKELADKVDSRSPTTDLDIARV